MISISRRQFLKRSALGMGGLALGNFSVNHRPAAAGPAFPTADKLGRVCAGGEGAQFDLKIRPDWDSQTTGKVLRDDVIVWLREVVASKVDRNRINQRWVETPKGYIYSAYVQPVKNLPNQPVLQLPTYSKEGGMWVECTVPYVDFTVEEKVSSPWLKDTLKPRLYYSQVMWVDQIRNQDSGQVRYRLREKFGSYGDVFWASGDAFRIITPDDLAPIRPEVQNKTVRVNRTYQTLSCLEGKEEVYFCRVSTGWDGATPTGTIPTWRKMVSTHMSGGSTGAGYDTPGIGWTVLFSQDGAAIHSTFWHNDFGLARTHGCVNTMPEDAQWIFRWTQPAVNYDPGDITIVGMNASTKIIVEDQS